MAGCRSLTDREIAKVLGAMDSDRDKCLFILGIRTGFRIAELLSINVGMILAGGNITDRLIVQRRNVKGKTKGRSVVLHPEAKQALQDHLAGMFPGSTLSQPLPANEPLFKSRVTGGTLSYSAAIKLLKAAYKRAGITGPVAWHSTRKSFATKVYTNLKYDLLATRDALGHSDTRDTERYLEVSQGKVDAAILAG